jgi:hypothetical protein
VYQPGAPPFRTTIDLLYTLRRRALGHSLARSESEPSVLQISDDTRRLAGILLITIPTVEYGGVALLSMLRRREAGYMDNPLRQNLFRAGHAHAGVLLILALVCQIFVDAIVLSPVLAWIARLGVPAAAILMPAGFFLSVGSPRAETPNGAIRLVYAGAAIMAVALLILGVGLVRASLA